MKTAPITSLLWRSQRAYQVFGANTDVGKTIFTTLLCKGTKKLWNDRAVTFLKPVSTGPAHEADTRHIKTFAPDIVTATLFQYDDPVSPHIAARGSSMGIPSDRTLLASCREYAAKRARQGNGWLFLETAGGVHSPTPSGTTQADLYMPLRLPSILIGDSRLGGISQTISAFESLRIRGYDVESVLLFEDDRYGNFKYLSEYFRDRHEGVFVAPAPEPPERRDVQADDIAAMKRYYEDAAGNEALRNVLHHLDETHERRIESLENMATEASRNIWYPFTQQALLTPKDITVIDSAHGDYFQTLIPKVEPSTIVQPISQEQEGESLLQASFDGSASWWTQGLGHSNPRLTLAAAYAAGRYGHVMFAGSVHQPALTLARTLLTNLGNPRLRRVFFSDDGSTGVEVAIKMALRAAKLRYDTEGETTNSTPLEVIGLKGGYHGDTIGAMDCAEPCAFNEKTDWYRGRGYWFDYPTVLCVDGNWQIKMPDEMGQPVEPRHFASLSDVFNIEGRESTGEHLVYEEFVLKTLRQLHQDGRKFGALILEPVVLGAGGMALADPLFQRALVNVVRRSADLFNHSTHAEKRSSASANIDGNEWSGLPVVFDEVFTGLFRLGRFTSSSFLKIHPDISVHAKLLTGGLVPLATTVASESIFQTFSSNDKTDALLHGHSYTAHPIGCQVAVESLQELLAMERNGSWDWAKRTTGPGRSEHQDAIAPTNSGEVWSVWPGTLVDGLSRQSTSVFGAWALGSVLAVHLKDDAGAGYSSNAAVNLRDALMCGEAEGPWNVHCRVLGNVLYLMASQKTTPVDIERLGDLLQKCVRAL
ncbi:hypothetical protein N0V93_000930 [Gnomoniopsis smithogilvyi]|uniref:Adenosylmethionine-8-amino-7-oxononanoate aminotransferase n=1 Tax=Gnomoniopsis smithogilvyi TaxID=1191159 RepID=A0A9W9D1S9_9PEZI|nr:hypothetical protein N0V93_000930 [Gnomoniopsis smithogilvyi]